MRRDLQLRDLEVLRTIARLRYVTTGELLGRFFPSDDVARRRLTRLRDRGLISLHRKGVPESVAYEAWRLAPAGIDRHATLFPGEPPCASHERLSEGSLVDIDHREAVNRIYLDLVAPPDLASSGYTSDSSASSSNSSALNFAAVKARARALRGRAEQIAWQPDGDVILRIPSVAGEQQVIPDATITSASTSGRRVRVFLELDRSTRGLGRIAESLHRYRRYLHEAYARDFRDGAAPRILYVVRSPGRQAGIARLLGQTFPGSGAAAPHQALVHHEAIPWLRACLFSPESAEHHPSIAAQSPARATSPPHGHVSIAAQSPACSETRSATASLKAIAAEVYTWMRAYRTSLRARGEDLPDDGRTLFHRLYLELGGAGAGPGNGQDGSHG